MISAIHPSETMSVAAAPYHELASSKRARLLNELNELTHWHAEHCEPYRRILSAAFAGQTLFRSIEELPAIPVRLFKTIDLVSVPPTEIVKTMHSSGTSSQGHSKVFLDMSTAGAQTRALLSIMKSLLGSKRVPMVIVDNVNTINQREAFSARAAAVRGFSQLGCDHLYLLNDAMEVNWDALQDFTSRHKGETLLVFGFTFIIWQYFYQESLKRGKLDLSDGILIHGGGWKKLTDQQVSNEEFKRCMRDQLGVRHVYNYYGLVEQTGSIFIECAEGNLHAPAYADVLIRHPETFRPLPFGARGLLQLMSNIPRSYPGHVLLTEDLGLILGEDDCPCDRKGKYFMVEGRLPHAELRGCSDTYQERL